MKEELFPIGTICTLKSDSRLVMIVGYLLKEYDKGLKSYMYSGCYYPEGILSNKVIGFNEEDISRLIFKGFSNNLFENLNDDINIICGNIPVAIDDQEKLSVSNGAVFDKNGQVVADDTPKAKDNMLFGDENAKEFANDVVSNIPINYEYELENDLGINYNPIVKPIVNNNDAFKKDQDLSIFDKYNFDEK